jgi:hypothetical protein
MIATMGLVTWLHNFSGFLEEGGEVSVGIGQLLDRSSGREALNLYKNTLMCNSPSKPLSGDASGAFCGRGKLSIRHNVGICYKPLAVSIKYVIY